ncbi:MAG: chorismate-binding protein, partial [Gemmatimonadetes bacterium]|nr:chorismate-binding protein [Gemmatimonadota bacterium]
MYTPTFEQFRELALSANLIPVYREISADLETPVSAYLKTGRPPYSFLLESVEGGESIGRYSFIGTEPSSVLRTGPGEAGGPVDPLAALKAHMAGVRCAAVPGLPKFHGGAVGHISYDAVRHFEPRVPPLRGEGVGVPESVFMITDSLLAFDHVQHKIAVIAHARVDASVAPGEADSPEAAYRAATARIEELVARLEGALPPEARRRLSTRVPAGIVSRAGGFDYDAAPERGRPAAEPGSLNMPRETYGRMVERARRAIHQGEFIQVVLSQRLSRRTSLRPFDIYRSLRRINPSPYMFYLDLDGFQIIGASPELLVQVIDGQIAVHPIAGTRPRGTTPEEDARLEADLLSDEKERAEHVMLLDLGRNDVGRVALPGTVQVTRVMDVERYSHVMHLVSHVTGRLRPDCDAYEALRAGFPAGTVSGAPKVRAMEFIAQEEPDKRGPYAGAVGYFSYSGNMDTCIGIRTIVLKDGVAHIQAGGGIVADSTPDGE